MTSPFSTIEEFNAAIDGPTEGAIYTFAHTPAINSIALLVADCDRSTVFGGCGSASAYPSKQTVCPGSS